MLLKVIDDLRKVSTLQNDLIRDLIKEVRARAGEGETAIARYEERAAEADQILDIIEYNSRRI